MAILRASFQRTIETQQHFDAKRRKKEFNKRLRKLKDIKNGGEFKRILNARLSSLA